MSTNRKPFNISILKLDKGQLRILDQIDSIDTLESPQSSEFHPKGLFSTDIFGKVGEPERDTTFAYISLNTAILHPFVYKRLERVRKFYIQIINGERYAIFDKKKKDFVAASEDEGDTGFSFFMRHWDELEIPYGNSDARNDKIDLINKFRDKSIIENTLILPAGLRDADVNEHGQLSEEEINTYYKQLIGASKTISSSDTFDDPTLDTTRSKQQKSFNQIYEYLGNLLEGKDGFIQDRWAKRGVAHGTRNVITSMNITAPTLNEPTMPGPDDTAIGLMQLSKGALPVTVNRLRESLLSKVFGTGEGMALLVNPETYISEYVEVSIGAYDRWTSVEGLEKVIAEQNIIERRHKEILIDDYYLALVYKPKDWKVFKIFQDINELPNNYSKDDVYPITLTELIYLSNYWGWNDLAMQICRYPVTGEESVYVSKVFVQTTVNSEPRVELDDEWQMVEENVEEHTAWVYPIFDPPSYIDSTMVHPFRLGGLGGDYDGDTVSANILYSQESLEEINNFLKTRKAHVDPSGKLRASAAIDNIELILRNMTGEPKSD